MGLLAIFGIHNDALNRVVSLLILFLVVVYLALIYWTYADARRRIADPMLVVCATLCSVIPFAGTIVYMIVRPPEYLEDARERELEIAAAEARLAQLETGCPYCESEIAGAPATPEPSRRRSGRRASAAASTLAAEQEPTSRYETRGDSGTTARTRPPSG